LSKNAKVLEVDTNNISEDEVFTEVLNHTAMSFMGS